MWDLCQYSNNVAIVDDNGLQLTYRDLNEETEALAKNIAGRSLVFILCCNKVASIIGYVSCINNKNVPLLLNSELEKNSVLNLIRLYRPSYLWVPKNKIDCFKDVSLVYNRFDYCLLRTDYESRYPLYSDLALLLTTSGSTGSPKFVRQSYTNIKSNTESIIQYLELDHTERPITTLPMNYTYGLSIINTHLMVGATILLTECSIMEKEFWSFFKENKATSFGGVPYTYEMLDRLRFEKMDLPSLRTMTQAGGKLSKELQMRFTENAKTKGIKFIVMYGQCEATARMSYLPMDEAETHYGSIGIPIPGGCFSIIDDNGNEIIQSFKEGELVYYGDNVTLGYATCGDDLVKGDERNGMLKTGDIAMFDEDHYYYIVGRMKRFLKVYGNRVNLDELEQLIKNQFKEIDVAVSGYDDHIFVYIKNEGKSYDDMKSFLSHKTGINSVAFGIKMIDEIPKNESGKVLYQELKLD